MPPVIQTYDPNSPAEQAVVLPSASRITLSDNAVLQPPLTHRGTGPGMIMFLPAFADLNPRLQGDNGLDPEPIQKWAEEGFVVVGITSSSSGWSLEEALDKGFDVLLTAKELDIKHKFAVIGAILLH
jgi:carboxymethylenebutenolidase